MSWYVRNHVKLHAGTKFGPYTKIIWNNKFAGKIKEFARDHGQGQEFALCKSVVEIVLESYEENKIVKDGQKILWYGNDMKLYNKKSVDIAEEGCKLICRYEIFC